MRYIAALIIAALVNLGLFLLIFFMMAGQQSGFKQMENIAAVDFVRLRREPEPPKPKERQLPKKPPPPKEPLPLMARRPQAPSPQKSPLPQVIPHIEIPLAKSAGPYLGDYRQSSAGPTIAMAMEGELVPLVRIPPQYPPRAARRGIQGAVTVAFIITRKGSVRNPKVIEAHPPEIFNEAALRAIKRWRFKAKQVEGQWVEQQATQTIEFRLSQ